MQKLVTEYKTMLALVFPLSKIYHGQDIELQYLFCIAKQLQKTHAFLRNLDICVHLGEV